MLSWKREIRTLKSFLNFRDPESGKVFMKRVLKINQKVYSYDQISSGDFDLNRLSDFEKSTLIFCKDWLNGKKDFELQTSGSTGIPKKINIYREQMKASAWQTINKLGLSAGDAALVCIDTAYIGGKMMLVRGMEADLKLIAVEPTSNPFEALAPAETLDFVALVPLQLQTSLENNEKTRRYLDKMKAIIVGGGVIDPQLENAIQTIAAPVYATYGMTETVSHVALKKMNAPGKDKFFKVLENIEIGQDNRGCLSISGAVTNNKKIVTNDVVELIDERTFQWLGRADNIINSGGIKINPENIEQQISDIAGEILTSRRFFVTGLKDKVLGEEVTLVVEGNPLTKADEESLLEDLKAGLPLYHHPRKAIYLPYFVETPTGKINRNGSIEPHLKKS